MSVAVDLSDSWINHLAFAQPRPSAYGLIDGVWSGILAVVGDATGGVTGFDGRLSRERQTDWIYVLGGYCLRRPVNNGADVYIEFRSGPRVPQQVALGIDVPTYSVAGPMVVVAPTGDPMATFPAGVPGGDTPYLGMYLYGDPSLASTYDMVHAVMNDNVDTALNTLSLWGFMIRYQTFFRGTPPDRG